MVECLVAILWPVDSVGGVGGVGSVRWQWLSRVSVGRFKQLRNFRTVSKRFRFCYCTVRYGVQYVGTYNHRKSVHQVIKHPDSGRPVLYSRTTKLLLSGG